MATRAFSLDGRGFRFDVPVEDGVFVGEFVELVGAQARQLGQIESVDLSSHDSLVGGGRLLGTVGEAGFEGRATQAFSTALMLAATNDVVEAALSAATLRVGTLLGTDALAANLFAGRFNRHTFWCGQSGSGKTYALGVLLERLLVHTGLPMVILDPNADFVRLGELRPGRDDETTRRLQSCDIRVLRPHPTDPGALRVRFAELSSQARAAVLGLDPVADAEEYNTMLHVDLNSGIDSGGSIAGFLRSTGDPAAAALAVRAENLGVEGWDLWSREHGSATEVIDERPDATVLDLGGFADPLESAVAAMAVLDDLWARREQRRPILIVIDEAHNLASPELTGPVHTAVRERIQQIAAEGRKFGLWLLLSTQRPSKVHPGIVSQCDNVVVMRMGSPSDLAELSQLFGFVPKQLLGMAPSFSQGEAVMAGGFIPVPSLVRVDERLTFEGGIDVEVPQRTP